MALFTPAIMVVYPYHPVVLLCLQAGAQQAEQDEWKPIPKGMFAASWADAKQRGKLLISLMLSAEAMPIRYRDGRPLKQLSEYYKQDKDLVEVILATFADRLLQCFFAPTCWEPAAGDYPSRVHDRNQQTGADMEQSSWVGSGCRISNSAAPGISAQFLAATQAATIYGMALQAAVLQDCLPSCMQDIFRRSHSICPAAYIADDAMHPTLRKCLAASTWPCSEPRAKKRMGISKMMRILSGVSVQVKSRQLWGDKVYTDDSDLVAVLMHLGYFATNNASVSPQVLTFHALLRLLPPRDQYTSCFRNAVRSRAWFAKVDGCSYEVGRSSRVGEYK